MRHLPKVIFVTGAPGAGKRTQCAKIVEKYKFNHLNVLNCLKQESEGESELATKIKDCLAKGELVPSSLVCEVLDKHLGQLSSDSRITLIEGFPKNQENIDAWNKRFRARYYVYYCFYFHCQRRVLEERLHRRSQENNRLDDSEAIVKKRLDTFERERMPIVNLFTKSKNLVHINSQRKVENVFK